MDNTKIALAIFDKRAKDYENKFMDVSLYHDSLDVFCNNVKPRNAAILELACGPGNITTYLLERRPDFKILATDLSPNMIKLGKSNIPNAEFAVMDCRNISDLNNKFDAIMCSFCLPYL